MSTGCIYNQCMLHLRFSPAILEKLEEKHQVTRREVEQCFDNRCGEFLVDDREDHQTDPATLWFVAPTNNERLLKICFMFVDGNILVKSAFAPNDTEIRIYENYGK